MLLLTYKQKNMEKAQRTPKNRYSCAVLLVKGERPPFFLLE